MKRALKLLLPALILAEVALVWSGLFDLTDAVFVVVGIEVLLLATAAGEVFLVVCRYRRGRSAGLDFWAALEVGLAVLLPRKAARIAVLEPRLWVCLLRWLSRRTGPSDREFGYHKRSQMRLILVMLAFTTPVELLVLELLAPWAWLRISLLVLGLYALLWMFGLYASLVTLLHRLEEDELRLRYGALAEGFVPFSEIATVQLAQRRAPGPGDGLQADTEDGGIYLATGGRTDLTLMLHSPRTIQGLFRSTGPAPTIHLAADEPQKLAPERRARIGEGSRSKPPALV